MRRLNDIVLKPKDRQAVEILSGLLRERFPVDRVILFGSKARGDDGPDSDIDLLVLTSRLLTQDERREMAEVVLEVELRLDVLVSKLVVPSDSWDHGLYQALPIRREVEREGVAA
jgi:predicted nucleotidyltransferase